jgi:hypothetical protein
MAGKILRDFPSSGYRTKGEAGWQKQQKNRPPGTGFYSPLKHSLCMVRRQHIVKGDGGGYIFKVIYQ